ncbi:hypothetical protein [Moorena sp. SIO3F7]|uniref:hypothetical protein n=1 Tax=unclassified Moorena TaxID=2683338 RepID=UPI0013FE80C7|nr:hypothetical protein [Moorena sp. SIO3E8]NEP98207.1 hypothetical protein [Moorena sp. SIO3F7]
MDVDPTIPVYAGAGIVKAADYYRDLQAHRKVLQTLLLAYTDPKIGDGYQHPDD